MVPHIFRALFVALGLLAACHGAQEDDKNRMHESLYSAPTPFLGLDPSTDIESAVPRRVVTSSTDRQPIPTNVTSPINLPVSFDQTINAAGLFHNGANAGGGGGGCGNDDGGDNHLPYLPSAVSSVMYWKRIEHDLAGSLPSAYNDNDQLEIESAQEQLSQLNHQIFGESTDTSDEDIASFIQLLEYEYSVGSDSRNDDEEQQTESDEPVAEILYTDLFGKTRVLSGVGVVGIAIAVPTLWP